MALASGAELGPYRLLGPLGSGGMGEVYKALDTRLNRTVAIKVLPKEAVSDPKRHTRFVQEARAASALDHPNIITIYDIAEAQGVPFIVMQYVPGKTLRELMNERRLALSELLGLAVQIAEGLSRAHGQGIIHRDQA